MVLILAPTSDSASVLVAAALLTGDHRHLDRATPLAATIHERQLVVLADAHLRGHSDLLDARARPPRRASDHLLSAWIAGRPTAPGKP